ncbi:MAG: carboxypeptidase regulatory-like domain-containing protein [Acidobacteriota bacterium]
MGAALLAVWPAAAPAQTSGGLRGQITDDRGWPIPGATVTVVSTGRGVTGRGAVTDDAGFFQVPALPASRDYIVLVSFPGYATVRMSEVEVVAGRYTTLRIALSKQSEFEERVKVRARAPTIDLERTGTETRFTSEFIDSLPLLGRNYQDLLALVPGVTDVDGDGNPNIHGARETNVNTLVDGVSTTDPLTGLLGAQLNIESIQEIEVITSGATAEFSRAQGGFANVITKSGGNDFRGSFKFFWRGSALDGNGAGVDDPRLHGGVGESGLRDLTFDDFTPFLSFEGPIVRDRAWFFTSLEYIQIEEPVNALNSAFVRSLQEFRGFGKFTFQLTPNNRLALSINYDPQEHLNQGLNSFTREESGFTLDQGGVILTLKATSIFNPSVALETTVSSFNERPGIVPTLDPDTNGNGVLFIDHNGNGFIELTERDAGEDFDNDGAFDVFEDFDRDRILDASEDLDGDGRLTPFGGCEGRRREDVDCDGHLDFIPEDLNGNGRLDPGEDLDGDGRLDAGDEDRNGNQILDDRPFPAGLYPYGAPVPVPPDRDYVIDQRIGITSGPYFETTADRRRRFTFRQDLGAYVPDYWGSHNIKAGWIAEREKFDRRVRSRAVVAPFLRATREGPSTVRSLIPALVDVGNEALSLTTGLYLQDSYKPFPNLSIGLGLRFDREAIDSFGYTFFEPSEQRALYDRLWNLGGGERGLDDSRIGNDDGIDSQGFCGDPIFSANTSTGGDVCKNPPFDSPVVRDLNQLRSVAASRLTRHHTEASFISAQVAALFPDIVVNGEIDPERLAERGVQPQRREKFRLTNNNLAPRVSVSWDPWASGRTKIFATWGRYYDKLFLSTVVGEEGPDLINRYYVLDEDGVNGAGLPDRQIGRVISKAPPSATQVDRGLETPFSDEFTIGIEREIAPEVAVSVTYIDRRFRQQLQDIDVNHTLRPDPAGAAFRDDFGRALSGGLGTVGESRPDGRPDLFIHNFFFNQVLRVGNFNSSRYKAIEVSAVKRLSRRWELQGSYTYSRAVGSAEDFQSRLGNDPSTVESEFGYLDFDQRHVVKLNASTYLPADWQLGFSATWASGLPFSFVSRSFSLDNVSYQQFRTLFGRVELAGNGFEFRRIRRNSERNDSTLDINLRARKSLVLGRHVAGVFVEVFNLLNSDDLRVTSIDPSLLTGIDPDTGTPRGPLTVDGTRRFGRRFQIGFQIEF